MQRLQEKVRATPGMRPEAQRLLAHPASGPPAGSCFKVHMVCQAQAYQARTLPSSLKHEAGTTLGDGAQKSHKWHVKELNVAPKPLHEHHGARDLPFKNENWEDNLLTIL